MSKFSSYFRTGGQTHSNLELIYKSLNSSRGSAYAVEEGTAVAAENFGYAKALNDIYNANQRLANQFDPNKMDAFIGRWETILRLYPSSTDTISDRKNVIAQKMKMWTQPPTNTYVHDLLSNILGNIFIELVHYKAGDDEGTLPGGCGLPGGTVLQDGPWVSPVSICNIRVWQPRDKSGNKLISDNVFYNKISKASVLIEDYLNASTLINIFSHNKTANGLITGVLGGNVLICNNSIFPLPNYTNTEYLEIEVVDDDNQLKTYHISNIVNGTEVQTIEYLSSNITNLPFRYTDFYLDDTINLDSEIFS